MDKRTSGQADKRTSKRRLLPVSLGLGFMLIAVSAVAASAEGAWQFCRLHHEGGWGKDHPRAGERLIAMLEDVTYIDASPTILVVSPTGEDLSRCASVFASNVDELVWSADEATAVGDWLRKGGFLWTDGFWDDEAWWHWNRQLRKALPEARVWELDSSHPIFEYPFRVRLRQRGYMEGWVKNFAVEDDRGRLMILMTLNERKDMLGAVGDSWEGFGRHWQNQEEMSWGFAVNVLLHVMTH